MHPPPASKCHHLLDIDATSFQRLTATASGQCLFDCQ